MNLVKKNIRLNLFNFKSLGKAQAFFLVLGVLYMALVAGVFPVDAQ